MKKNLFITTILTLLLALLLPVFSSVQPSAETNVQTIHDSYKPWTITFSNNVAKDNQNLQLIYIESASKQKLEASIKISAESNKVIVKPENPYLFGETYTLVIPKGFQSANGKKTTREYTKQFKVEGDIIKSISAIDKKPLFTHVVVSGSTHIAHVEVVVNDESSTTLIRNKQEFSKGILGVSSGAHLTIHAYDSYNNLLETQYYVVK